MLLVVAISAQELEVVWVIGNVPVPPILLGQLDDVMDFLTGLDPSVPQTFLTQTVGAGYDSLAGRFPFRCLVDPTKPGHEHQLF
jgi:hypothetical protein